MSETMKQDLQSLAEDLRLRGNDAFGTKDWERAASLYEESLAAHPTSKAATNYAATLCKVGRYQEAATAADRATTLDPTWAKGWWRRGVVAELLKQNGFAMKYYRIATELEPNQAVFVKDLRRIERINRVKGTTDDGMPLADVHDDDNENDDELLIKLSAGKQAMLQARQAVGMDTTYSSFATHYMHHQVGIRGEDCHNNPTSQQFLVNGMNQWVLGMSGAVASMCICTNQQAHQQYQLMKRLNPFDQERLIKASEAMAGGFSTGHELSHLVSGLAHVGGKYVLLETTPVVPAPTPQEARSQMLCPPPPTLSRFVSYQVCSVVHVIDLKLKSLFLRLGFDHDDGTFVCSRGVLDASEMYYANMQARQSHKVKNDRQDPTPDEVIQFIQGELRRGTHTWENGIRNYVSLQFRGTVLMACILILFGEVGIGYKFELGSRIY
jgi:tetratricopeptide (TPR) repeat protein